MRGAAAWEYHKLLKSLRVLWGEERLAGAGSLGGTALSRPRGMWRWLEWQSVTMRSWLHDLPLGFSSVVVTMFRESS